MNKEALIELIARRVMEQVGELPALQQEASPSQQSVLVIGDADRVALGELLGGEFKLSFLADTSDLCTDNYDHIVLAKLSNKLLSEMAIGLERGADGCVIVESLMKGKAIYVLEEGIDYRRYKETAKPAFYQLFQNKEQKLLAYGMEVVVGCQLKAALTDVSVEEKKCCTLKVELPVPVVRQKREKPQALILDKRVINEGDLRRGFDQGYKRVIVQPKTLITPLAQDYIRTKSLQVERVEQ